ncbi:CPBP family intramembrane glutamic endopeptidase [Halorussus halophilus]|uniref:CPBP family intramembrane glutamic endopeptidase n=1 Tax=Halorussus halophilus TaxID=2650975 RepID=UPI0017882623|nr:type II CAAX endopeptidase family protein [Halorussus halophilus]
MKFVREHPVATFFALALALSWALWIPGFLLLSGDVSTALVIVGSFGPAVAGVILTKARGRSVRTWLREMARFRVGARWWAVAVGVPVGITVVSTVVYATWVGPLDLSTLSRRVPMWLVGFLVISLVGGGNEEPGWRGYALPNLQRRYSALTASIIIGLVWALWHLPLFVLPSGLYAGKPFSLYAPMVVTFSVLTTWVYNSTEGSVPVLMVLHAGFNSMGALVPVPLSNQGSGTMASWNVAVVLGCGVLLALVVVLYYGPETLSKGEKPTAGAVERSSTENGRELGEPADD